MENVITLAILIILVGAAVYYIWKEKKKGKRCIGCPCSGTVSCHCKGEKK